MNSEFIKSRINELENVRVLVIGDIGLDAYISGGVDRISPEAPVPVLNVQEESFRLGLAANVALNIQALKARATLVSVVGEDTTADSIHKLCEESGLESRYLIADSERPTTRKLRLLAGQHHIARVDFENKKNVSVEVQKKILALVDEELNNHDVVIIQDYAKGLITEDLCQKLIERCHQKGKKVLVDPYKSTPLKVYKGATLMTPNRDESLALAKQADISLSDELNVYDRVGELLMQELNSEKMVVTLGANGMKVFDDGSVTSLPTFAQDVYDVTGAGDTVIGSIALGLGANWSLVESCYLANLTAGVVVAQVGCATCSPDELMKFQKDHQL